MDDVESPRRRRASARSSPAAISARSTGKGIGFSVKRPEDLGVAAFFGLSVISEPLNG
jgi:hypothetical protein